MTESDAKLKRCGGPPGCGTIIRPNSGGMHHDDLSLALKEPNRPRWCTGSDCMSWRETDPKNYGIPRDGKTSEPTGYCGLSGKP